MFDKARLYAAVLNVALFATVAVLFAFSRFSFGYFLGFYFYTMILGYLWLVEFSQIPATITPWQRFGVCFRAGIPPACAVHHVADQAKVCPVGASA